MVFFQLKVICVLKREYKSLMKTNNGQIRQYLVTKWHRLMNSIQGTLALVPTKLVPRWANKLLVRHRDHQRSIKRKQHTNSVSWLVEQDACLTCQMPILNYKCQVSSVKILLSSGKCQVLIVKWQLSKVKCQASSVKGWFPFFLFFLSLV